MGFFSWETQDTKRSIPSRHSNRKTFKVVLSDDKGNQWVENNYEGYGMFGGKDFYELLAEMNPSLLPHEEQLDRDFGLWLWDNGNLAITYPSLTENGVHVENDCPARCEYQGYFYPMEETRTCSECWKKYNLKSMVDTSPSPDYVSWMCGDCFDRCHSHEITEADMQ